jgi:hypothetical protein
LRGLEPKDECSVCSSEYDEECGGVQGYFGILPVTFCEYCFASVIDMAKQFMEDEDGE